MMEESALALGMVLLALLLLPVYLDLAPVLWDVALRPRKAIPLEANTRIVHERSLVVAYFLPALGLYLGGHRLFDPSFFRPWPVWGRWLGICLALMLLVFLRELLWRMVSPRQTQGRAACLAACGSLHSVFVLFFPVAWGLFSLLSGGRFVALPPEFCIRALAACFFALLFIRELRLLVPAVGLVRAVGCLVVAEGTGIALWWLATTS